MYDTKRGIRWPYNGAGHGAPTPPEFLSDPTWPILARQVRQLETYRAGPCRPESHVQCIDTKSRVEIDIDAELPNEQILPKNELPKLLREFFVHNEYDRKVAIMILQIGITHCGIKVLVINTLPSFYIFKNKDLYKHLDEFLNMCRI